MPQQPLAARPGSMKIRRRAVLLSAAISVRMCSPGVRPALNGQLASLPSIRPRATWAPAGVVTRRSSGRAVSCGVMAGARPQSSTPRGRASRLSREASLPNSGRSLGPMAKAAVYWANHGLRGTRPKISWRPVHSPTGWPASSTAISTCSTPSRSRSWARMSVRTARVAGGTTKLNSSYAPPRKSCCTARLNRLRWAVFMCPSRECGCQRWACRWQGARHPVSAACAADTPPRAGAWRPGRPTSGWSARGRN